MNNLALHIYDERSELYKKYTEKTVRNKDRAAFEVFRKSRTATALCASIGTAKTSSCERRKGEGIEVCRHHIQLA